MWGVLREWYVYLILSVPMEGGDVEVSMSEEGGSTCGVMWVGVLSVLSIDVECAVCRG